MFVTSAEQRAGLLVAVITGGRPQLQQRPVRTLLPALRAAGVADITWVVSSADVDSYEPDEHGFSVYPRDWAVDYARAHWMQPRKPGPGDFLGAFPGREWACREAERRGYWGVLQLDDNIDRVGLVQNGGYGERFVRERGGLALFADLLSAVLLATNARTCGAQVGSVSPAGNFTGKVARAGFPYSLFIEQVGAGREPWYGPLEDDITHSLQYGSRFDGATAALIPLLVYHKETTSKTGMRKHYNATRSVQLQRLFPESTRLSLRSTTSNGRGAPRVFHSMPPGAIRNPLIVKDPATFAQVRARMETLMEEYVEGDAAVRRAKVMRRAGKPTASG